MPYQVRHRLIHVRQEAFARLIGEAATEPARAGLQHWMEQQLPLVVTGQPSDLPLPLVCVGLPLPAPWGRLRLGLRVPRVEVLAYTAFPSLASVVQAGMPAFQPLVDRLRTLGLYTQVYGSHGWQTLSGLSYVHERSDLDLLIRVGSDVEADLATEALGAQADGPVRLDGELMFPDGSAVAWREWAAWRAGQTTRFVVKTLRGAHLSDHPPVLQSAEVP